MAVESEIRKLKQNMRSVAIALLILVIILVIIPILSLIGAFSPILIKSLAIVQIFLDMIFLCMVLMLFSEPSWKTSPPLVYHLTPETENNIKSLGIKQEDISFYHATPLLSSQSKVLIELEKQHGEIYHFDQHTIAHIGFKTKEFRVIELNITRSLSFLPENIDALEDLVHLNLTACSLSNLPDTITKLSKLKILCLRDNYLTALPTNIGSLKLLEQLDLRKNRLSILPESFWSLSNLEVLDITDNIFLSLIPRFLELPKLKTLYLRKKEFRKLSTEEKQVIEQLKSKGCEIELVSFSDL